MASCAAEQAATRLALDEISAAVRIMCRGAVPLQTIATTVTIYYNVQPALTPIYARAPQPDEPARAPSSRHGGKGARRKRHLLRIAMRAPRLDSPTSSPPSFSSTSEACATPFFSARTDHRPLASSTLSALSPVFVMPLTPTSVPNELAMEESHTLAIAQRQQKLKKRSLRPGLVLSSGTASPCSPPSPREASRMTHSSQSVLTSPSSSDALPSHEAVVIPCRPPPPPARRAHSPRPLRLSPPPPPPPRPCAHAAALLAAPIMEQPLSSHAGLVSSLDAVVPAPKRKKRAERIE